MPLNLKKQNKYGWCIPPPHIIQGCNVFIIFFLDELFIFFLEGNKQQRNLIELVS